MHVCPDPCHPPEDLGGSWTLSLFTVTYHSMEDSPGVHIHKTLWIQGMEMAG